MTTLMPDADAPTEGSAKKMILQATAEQGHTDSYGVLLYVAALMSLRTPIKMWCGVGASR